MFNFQTRYPTRLAAGAMLALSCVHVSASTSSASTCHSGVVNNFGSCENKTSYGRSIGTTSAQVGVLRASAKAYATPPDPDRGLQVPIEATARASFSTFRIIDSDPSLEGKLGHAVAFWNLDSTVSADVGTNSQALVNVSFRSIVQANDDTFISHANRNIFVSSYVGFPLKREARDTADFNGESVPFGSQLRVEWDFRFGARETTQAYLLVGASAVHSGTAIADASHTIWWGGIQSVTFEGEEVPYTVTDDSGFDWRHAAVVPEPTPAALLVVGLLGLAGVRRHLH